MFHSCPSINRDRGLSMVCLIYGFSRKSWVPILIDSETSFSLLCAVRSFLTACGSMLFLVKCIFPDPLCHIWWQVIAWVCVIKLVFALGDWLLYQSMWALRAIPGLPGSSDRVIEAIVIEGTTSISLSPFGYRVDFLIHALLLWRPIAFYLNHWHMFFFSEFIEAFGIKAPIKPPLFKTLRSSWAEAPSRSPLNFSRTSSLFLWIEILEFVPMMHSSFYIWSCQTHSI